MMSDTRIPVGRLDINPLEKLVRVGSSSSSDSTTPSLGDLDMASDLFDNDSGNTLISNVVYHCAY